MINFRITVECGACVSEYHITEVNEYMAKMHAFRFFDKEYPNAEYAQVTKVEYLFSGDDQ